MAVVVRTKSQQETAFKTAFGVDTFNSMKNCLAFGRKFTASAVSNILFLRSNLPEDSFDQIKLPSMGKKSFRTTTLTRANPTSNKICELIKSAMEAHKKGCLEELSIIFLKSGSDEVIEEHTLSYKYPCKTESASVNSTVDKDDEDTDKRVKLQISKLVLNLIAFNNNNLSELPDHVDLEIRLVYNQSAPKGYAPEGYEFASPGSLFSNFGGLSPKTIRMGRIETKWHGIALEARSTLLIGKEKLPSQMNETLSPIPLRPVVSSPIFPPSTISDGNRNEDDALDHDDNSTVLSLEQGLDETFMSLSELRLAEKTKKRSHDDQQSVVSAAGSKRPRTRLNGGAKTKLNN